LHSRPVLTSVKGLHFLRPPRAPRWREGGFINVCLLVACSHWMEPGAVQSGSDWKWKPTSPSIAGGAVNHTAVGWAAVAGKAGCNGKPTWSIIAEGAANHTAAEWVAMVVKAGDVTRPPGWQKVAGWSTTSSGCGLKVGPGLGCRPLISSRVSRCERLSHDTGRMRRSLCRIALSHTKMWLLLEKVIWGAQI
jgi:hypothetical protein